MVRAVIEETELTAQHRDKAKQLRELHQQWSAQMPPVGLVFQDTTEGDDTDAKPVKPKQVGYYSLARPSCTSARLRIVPTSAYAPAT